MAEVENDAATSEAFRQRAVNILRERCANCLLANKLIARAGMDEGCIHEGPDAFRRLGKFIGGVMEEIEPSNCNGDNCLSAEQESRLKELLREEQTPSDPTCAEPMVELAIAEGVLPLWSNF